MCQSLSRFRRGLDRLATGSPARRLPQIIAPADRHLDPFAPARSAFGLPVSFFAPNKFRSTRKAVRALHGESLTGLALTTPKASAAEIPHDLTRRIS